MTRFFNKNLKYIRQLRKMSQQDLADKLKLDRSTISRWENDEMDVTVGNAIQISKIFNIPLETMIKTDLSVGEKAYYDELFYLFNSNKDILTEDDKEYMKFIIEKRKKEKEKDKKEEL